MIVDMDMALEDVAALAESFDEFTTHEVLARCEAFCAIFTAALRRKQAVAGES